MKKVAVAFQDEEDLFWVGESVSVTVEGGALKIVTSPPYRAVILPADLWAYAEVTELSEEMTEEEVMKSLDIPVPAVDDTSEKEENE